MLTQAQIDSFHRDGFLIMPGVVRGRELEALREESARVIADGVARRGEHHLYSRGADGSDTYWRSERMWERHAIFRAVSLNPELLENIGQCVGHEFFPWNDSLVVKIPGGGPVGWHQDPFAEHDRERSYVVPNFTTDIYLDDSDEENGCVWAIPGHHLVGNVDIYSKTQDELFERYGAVPVRMRPGDVLFHCLTTPHGSRANLSSRMRRTFYIHYIAQEAHDQSGYRQWRKTWWGEEKRAQLTRMAADRAALGLSEAYGPRIRMGEEGLAFTGSPCTPRRHWGSLAYAIPDAQRKRLKALTPVEQTAQLVASR
jgi:ectoine hydroxylase-related dioxygenase (phytanoyl-CoA dioxygenase family)